MRIRAASEPLCRFASGEKRAPEPAEAREFGHNTTQVVHHERGEITPIMMTNASKRKGPLANASILLASDSERHGKSMQLLLKEQGYAIDYAGSYGAVETHLERKDFDLVLLEVTSEHAVEPAVDAALRVKRANAHQFVGYLADADLETSGLAGDAIFPRNAERLRQALRQFLANDPGD